MAKNGNRKRDSQQLILALASGATVKDAAREAGIGERTAHRRLEDREFRAAVTRVRDDIYNRAVGQLASLAAKAIDTLGQLLEDSSPTVKLGAARAILENATRMREFVELNARLTALEELSNKP